MKRIFILFLIFTLCANSAFSFSLFKKKEAQKVEQTEEKSGYKGELPDINKDFEKERAEANKKKIEQNFNTNLDKDELTKIPLANPKYVEIIMKKNDPSSFVLDVRDIINILEKLKTTIDTGRNSQFFNSQVANLINNVNYLQEHHYGTKEYNNFIAHESLIQLCENARNVAILNTSQQLFKQYIPSSEYEYSPQNINGELKQLSKDIGDIIDLLKNME